MTATPVERQAARDYLLNNTDPDINDLLDAIRAIYADGIVTGTGTAAEATGTPVTATLRDLLPDSTQGDVDWGKFWDAWTPGDPKAAALLTDGGWSDLLAQADITVKGITDTVLSQMGTALADGVAAGDSVATITASLAQVMGDQASRAELVARTETDRAVSAASIKTYLDAGLGQYEILVSPDACDECADLEDGNPYDLDDDSAVPPIHPACRCSCAPITGTDSGTESD